MKSLLPMIRVCVALMALTSLVTITAGCETRERVVVRDRPAVRVYAPPPVVVQERVIVR
jgi:hypothetical protein